MCCKVFKSVSVKCFECPNPNRLGELMNNNFPGGGFFFCVISFLSHSLTKNCLPENPESKLDICN